MRIDEILKDCGFVTGEGETVTFECPLPEGIHVGIEMRPEGGGNPIMDVDIDCPDELAFILALTKQRWI